MCRQAANAKAEQAAVASLQRPPGRARALPVARPPWHLVGHPASLLCDAYGGFWGVAAAGTASSWQRHDGTGSNPREADSYAWAALQAAESQAGSAAALLPAGRLCNGASRLLQPRWDCLRSEQASSVRQSWAIAKVFVTGKGACELGGAICMRSSRGTPVIAGFVTSRVKQRDSTAQVAGIAAVCANVWQGLADGVLINPYAGHIHRAVTLQHC